MTASTLAAAGAPRLARPALFRWAVGSLAACVLLLTYMQVFLVRAFDPPIALMFGLPAAIFIALMLLVRRRWAPLLGALYWLLFLAMNAPYLAHDLAHPEFFASFSFSVVLTITALAGLAAGLGAAFHAYRAPAPAALPGWFRLGLWGLAALALGAILVAAIAPANASAGVSAEALASLPALTTAQHKFDQAELRAQAGASVALRLENNDTTGHSFDIDELGLHVSMPPGQPALALFTAPAPGAYTFYCAVPGHRQAGMVGTLVVAP
jgi:uncharacterized cupredoxin-like copper-binding protein